MIDKVTPQKGCQVHRGEILHLLDEPQSHQNTIEDLSGAVEYFADGALVVTDGYIEKIGAANHILPTVDESASVFHHRNALITPGFIDCHVHYPQYQIIAAYGKQLLDWLTTHTFPEEDKFSDYNYASDIAARFLDELLANGTTTALVFGTVHPVSVDAFFEQARSRGLRMVCGKVMMDRNAPDYLTDTAAESVADSRALIKRWHGRDRLGYAVTPRFAPTSTPQQLEGAATLLTEHDGVLLHTHLAENPDECEWVKTLFPEQRSYLDVYDRYGLLTDRSVFAHSIYLDKTDWQRISCCGSSLAHCPTSNLFIGSGLFDLKTAIRHEITVGLGTDVGGGDSYSMLRTINEMYKIQQLQGYTVNPLQSLYLATLGGARTLSLDGVIGNFEPGKEADFNVLDYHATALIRQRMKSAATIEDKLFALQMLGDDRVIRQTWVMGSPVSRRV